jgi:hypothetical protein
VTSPPCGLLICSSPFSAWTIVATSSSQRLFGVTVDVRNQRPLGRHEADNLAGAK